MDFLLSNLTIFEADTSLNSIESNQQNTRFQAYQNASLHPSFPQTQCFQSCSIQTQFQRSSNRITNFNLQTFFQLTKSQTTILPHLGDLIGIVNPQICFSEILDQSTIIRIGKTQQINSLTALRKNALDVLLVCYDQSGCQFELEQIFLAEQRLILVVQSEEVLKTLLGKIHTLLTQLFIDQPLSQSSGILCIEIAQYASKYFLQFKDGSYFCKQFRNELRTISFSLQNQQQYQVLMKKIVLKDYLDFRADKSSVAAKMWSLKKEIELQSQQKKIQKQLELGDLVERASENEDLDGQINPIRKNSSFEADIQAEYFKIRQSEKKTGQTQIQEHIDPTHLFYLIEEHQHSCNSDKSEEKQIVRVPKSKLKRDETRTRSKSVDFAQINPTVNLDEEFFTKQ